jgi:peroxiredoxin
MLGWVITVAVLCAVGQAALAQYAPQPQTAAVALELGLAFHIGPKVLAAYRGLGIDLNELYGAAAGLLPVPATFVVRSDGTIDYAFVDPDFRLRAEPENVVRIVASLTR